MAIAQKCITGHTAVIYDRGGTRRMFPLKDLAKVDWGRVKSATTDATVTLSALSCAAQADNLNKIKSKRHELVLFRGTERVWEGPIEQVSWYADRVEIFAKTVDQYLNGTPLTKDWPNSDGGGSSLMTTRISQILNFELTTPYTMKVGSGSTVRTIPRWENIAYPANILPYLEIRPGTGKTRASTISFQMSVGEHLYNLTQGGVNYTVIGRKILVWDRETAIGRTRTLTEKDFTAELQVFEAGSDYADISHAIGQRDEAEPNPPSQSPWGVGNAGGSEGTNGYYGVWTRMISLSDDSSDDEPSQADMNSQAARDLTGRNKHVPLELVIPDGVGLRITKDLPISMLVPGIEMPVLAKLNLKPVSQLQMLQKMRVIEDVAGENVSVTLVPAGDIMLVDAES